MSGVKRYVPDHWNEVMEEATGPVIDHGRHTEYVLRSDYAALERERDEARECVKRLFPFVAAQLEWELRMRFSAHTEAVGCEREKRIAALSAAVDATPESLR